MLQSLRPLIGWFAALGVVCIWSGWVVISRLGAIQTLTLFDIMALRFFVASVVVAPFAWRFWPRQLKWWQIGIVCCGQGAPYLLLAFSGFQFAPASHAGIMMNGTLPVFAAIVSWVWLKEQPGPVRLFGMAVILVGCVLISSDKASVGVGPDTWIGHLFFMASAFTIAVYMIATKVWQLRPRQAMVCIPIVNLLCFIPFYLTFLPSTIARAPWSEIILQGAYQGLGPSVIAVFLFTTAVQTIGTSATAAMMALVPGVAALLAIPLLGELPGYLAWTGLFIVTAGIILAAGWRPAFMRLKQL